LRKIRFAVGLDQRKVEPFLIGASTIQGRLATNASLFGSLPVSASVLQNQIMDAHSAHLATKTNKGLVGVRTTKIGIVWTSLVTDCAYVQLLSDQNPALAQQYAEGSGFRIWEGGARSKALLDAELTNNKGEVKLEANASLLEAPSGMKSAQRLYLWRHTLDGKTYIDDDATTVSYTLIQGLPLLTEVGFQVAVKDSKGASAWSQTVTILIH
jgi:hypothetical protein